MNREMAEYERNAAGKVQSQESVWERWGRVVGNWLPYVTLAISTLMSMIAPGQTSSKKAETFALVALATMWIYMMHTRAPQPRHTYQARMIVYFAGLLASASVLMSHHPIFFVFTITGFFHASDLKPWPLAIAGVGATSILINTIITGFPWSTIEAWTLFLTIITIQTLAIGFGTLLGEKLAEQSEQRRQAVAKLEAALEENAGLHRQLLAQARKAGVLDERQRMAREIHDTLAQGLIGIITQLEAAQQAENRTGDRQRHLDHSLKLARESLAEARRSVNELRPEPLEMARLPDALANVAQQWSALNGLPVEIVTTGEPLSLHPEIEVVLLRTAQEALANIAKHAHAARVGMTLSYTGDDVILDVRDNGIGFVVKDQMDGRNEGFGLTAMRQRVNHVAGSLEIESEPGEGTAISVRVPGIPAQIRASES